MKLSNLLLFIIATGMGLALQKPALDYIANTPGFFIHHSKDKFDVAIFYVTLYVTSVLFAYSILLLWLRMSRPRPTLRRLSRSPGFAMNLAGIVGSIFVLLHYLTSAAIEPSRRSAGIYLHILGTGLGEMVGYFVIGALVPLVIAGRCLPEKNWFDRLGWLFGMTWIALVFAGWTRLYLNLLH